MRAVFRSPYGFLFQQLARAEFKARDQGTVLGFLWTLLQPALMFAVLYAVFIRWLGMFVENYAGYLLVGLTLWNFFSRATATGLSCFRRRAPLLRNYRFPRELMVLSSVAAVACFSLLELLILLPLLVWLGSAPGLAWLWLAPVIAAYAAFTAGVALLLAVAAAEFRDMERVWEVACTALFYATPVFYPASVLGGWKSALTLTPMAQALQAARACLLSGARPSLSALVGLAAVGCGALALGVRLTRARDQRITESVLT